jgi:mannan endo-1,4-beta-mannosidase
VSRNGTSLTLNSSPWQFVGYDDYRLTSASPGHQCGGALTDGDVAASLDEIQTRSGASVVRTWFMQAYGGPGNWGQFDRVLAAAAARGMKVIPVLSDQWASCEPWPAGQTRYRSLAWYQSGYRQADYGYGLSYRDYAAAIAAHYKGNATIAFWQLVNEAEALDSAAGPCQDATANAALRSFADDVAGLIKRNDPGHLISLGTIGSGQCGTSSGADYLNLHSGGIDICEYHDYFGPGGLPGDQWNGVAVRINQCHSLHKPIFAGEVGLQASIAADGSSGGQVTSTSLAQRAAFVSEKLHAQFGAGVAGLLIWQYATGPRTDGFEVQPGDPTEGVVAQVAALLARGGR